MTSTTPSRTKAAGQTPAGTSAPDPAKLPFFPSPRNDNERLLNYQHDFYGGSPSALDSFYRLALLVCRKYVSSQVRKNAKVRLLDDSDRFQKASDAASYVVLRYLTCPGFVISRSVTAYLYLRVIHELYTESAVEKMTDCVGLWGEESDRLASDSDDAPWD